MALVSLDKANVYSKSLSPQVAEANADARGTIEFPIPASKLPRLPRLETRDEASTTKFPTEKEQAGRTQVQNSDLIDQVLKNPEAQATVDAAGGLEGIQKALKALSSELELDPKGTIEKLLDLKDLNLEGKTNIEALKAVLEALEAQLSVEEGAPSLDGAVRQLLAIYLQSEVHRLEKSGDNAITITLKEGELPEELTSFSFEKAVKALSSPEGFKLLEETLSGHGIDPTMMDLVAKLVQPKSKQDAEENKSNYALAA